MIEDGTVGCCDYPVIGETKTIWFRGEDGIPVQKTGIVIKILKDKKSHFILK